MKKNLEKIFYPVIFHIEENGYSTFVPDLDGCFSQGDDMSQAVAMTQEAIGLMLEEYLERSEELPKPSKIEKIKKDKNDFVVMVEFDPVKYLEQNSNKAVKKTLTIPNWLNVIAEKNKINFSQILQKAIRQELNIN
jgi:predicted RNase H-like HicB family nuclease